MANRLEVLKLDETGKIIEKYISSIDCANKNNLSKTQINRYIKYKKHINGFVYVYSGVKSDQITHKYKANDVISDDYGSIKILECLYDENKKEKTYKYECLKCGYIGVLTESRIIKRKQRCSSCCKNSKNINKKNCLIAKEPWIKKYLLNIDDGYSYLSGSNKKIWFKCPTCGTIVKKNINLVVKHGLICNTCSVTVSIPNRTMSAILNKNKIKYLPEHSFDWSNGRRYDFYLPEYNTIIEMDGLQHYTNHFIIKTNEISKNDTLKEKLAKKNNIFNYIHINCKKSDIDFIIDNVYKNPFLKNILHTISRPEIMKEIESNNVTLFDICNLWNNGFKTTDIALKCNISNVTVSKYLKIGDKMNIVSYKGRIDQNKFSKKKVLNKINNKIYNSISECAKELGISRSTITRNKNKFLIF